MLTFTLDESLKATDNYNFVVNPTGTTIYSQTDLGFALFSENNAHTLRLNGGAALRAGDFSGQSDAKVTNPFVQLAYTQSTSTSLLSADARYSFSDVNNSILSPSFDPTDLSVSGGEREVYQFGLGLDTGIGAPFGLSLKADYLARDFSNTTDPSLFDNETASFDGTARFQINPTTVGRIIARIKDYDSEDVNQTARLTTGFGLGLDYDISPALRFSGDLTQNRTETTRTVGLVSTTAVREGVGLALNFDLDRPNGQITTSYTSNVFSTGRRDTITIGRSLDFPLATLRASLGVTKSDNTDAEPVANLNYKRQLKTGTFTASLSQAALTDNSGNEALRSQFSAGYQYDINSVSKFGATFSYSDYNVLTPGGTDTQRTKAKITYTRSLTPNWDMNTGYEYDLSEKTGRADIDANTVFFGIQRSFSFIP